MESWESLIGARMAEHLPVLHVPDHKKARKRYTNHLLCLRKKDLPEYKAQRAARQKRYRATDDYRTHHREEMRVWRAKKKQLTINQKEA